MKMISVTPRIPSPRAAACLDSATVLRLHLHSLEPAEMTQAKKHIVRCPKCRAKWVAVKLATAVDAELRREAKQ